MIRAAALITSAGSSTRMGSGEKKEYRLINGKSVLETCLESFIRTALFHQFIITVPKGHIPKVKMMVSSLKPDIEIIEGGDTRQESVFLGLQSLIQKKIDIVLIHDGARPWVSDDLIKNVYNAAIKHNACIPVIEIPDAPKQVNDSNIITKHYKKHTLFGAQTPQGFSFPLILEAHEKALKNPHVYADDAELFTLLGKEVYTVPGEYSNRKITYSHDLETT